jgi:excisionase family DNA binding protein
MEMQTRDRAPTASLQQISPLVSRKQAALYLGVATHTLEVWASAKRYALPYVRIGRLVKYRKVDLDRFIEVRLIGGAK